MKKILFFALLHVFLTIVSFSQNMVSDIQTYFIELKTDIKLKLDSCRTNTNLGNWRRNHLNVPLIQRLLFLQKLGTYGENIDNMRKKVDSLNLTLSWQMIYDDSMTERMIQLLNNEYRKDEFETLVNREMVLLSQNMGFEQDAMWQMKADTSKVFLMVKDSLNKYRNREKHPKLYQNFDVFLYMKSDTTARFRFVLDSVKKAEKEHIENYYLDNYHFDIEDLITVCGYVNDKRFVEPLINILKKSKSRIDELTKMLEEKESYDLRKEKNLNEKIIPIITDALVRMKVEPYRTDLLKKLTQPLDTIKKQNFTGSLGYLSSFADNPDYLLEISKYLYSEANTMYTSEGPEGTAYKDAYRKITEHIENKGLQDIINSPDFNLEKDRFKIYEWMQKNYGKYEIKRLW
jgi:uncharacterized protein YqfB (UPF0267 family)